MANTKTPVDQSAESITQLPHGRNIDVQAVLDQIGFWTRARIGFVVGSVLYDRSWMKFQASCERRPRRWFIVKLVADTYTIEVGRLVKKFYWQIDRQVEGVYAENLSEVVERLYQEVYY